VIFKQVGEDRPYPEHGLGQREWAAIPPRQVRLDQLVTTKRELALDVLLDEDSTFYGDLFAHVVEWDGTLYLEDGLHRSVRAALQQRNSIHARVHVVADAAAATQVAAQVAALTADSAEPATGKPAAAEPTETPSHN
jgi:Arc/MetJ family transcription regulator